MTRLSDITGAEATVEVDMFGHRVCLVYRPAAIPPNLGDELSSVHGKALTAMLARITTEVVTGWDVSDDDGSPTPLTPERLAAADPTGTVMLIMLNAVSADHFKRRMESIGDTFRQR